MRAKESSNWIDYQVVASGGGEKLEKWGDFYLLRPDPQAIWEAAFNAAPADQVVDINQALRQG